MVVVAALFVLLWARVAFSTDQWRTGSETRVRPADAKGDGDRMADFWTHRVSPRTKQAIFGHQARLADLLRLTAPAPGPGVHAVLAERDCLVIGCARAVPYPAEPEPTGRPGPLAWVRPAIVGRLRRKPGKGQTRQSHEEPRQLDLLIVVGDVDNRPDGTAETQGGYQRRGTGTALLDALVGSLRQEGVDQLFAHVISQNCGASDNPRDHGPRVFFEQRYPGWERLKEANKAGRSLPADYRTLNLDAELLYVLDLR